MDYQANTLKEFQKIIGTQHIDQKILNREEDRESQKLDKADLSPSVSSNDTSYSTIQNQQEHNKKNSFQFNFQMQQNGGQKQYKQQDELDEQNDRDTFKTDNKIFQNADSPKKQDQIKQSDKQNLVQKISQFNQQYLNPNKLTIIKEISSSQKCISDDNQENQTSIKICNSGQDKSSNNVLDQIPEEKSEQNITNQQLNSYEQKITNVQNFPKFYSGPKFQIKTELKNDEQEENLTSNQSSPENEDKLMNISNQENSHILENQAEKGQQCLDLVQHSPAPIFYNNIKQRAEKIKEVQREIIEHYIEPEFVIDEGESEGTETSEENEEEHKSLTRYNMQQQNLQRREKGKTIAQEDASSASPTLKTYISYIREIGLIVLFIMVVFFSITESLSIIITTYYPHFIEVDQIKNGDKDSNYKINISNTFKLKQHFFILFILGLLFFHFFMSFAKNYFFPLSMIRANTSMLDKMLKSIFKGKIQFFEYNPSGRILNRFSNDGGICDRLLPFAANQFFQYQFAFLAFIVYVAVQSPIILIFGFVALILVLLITKFAKKCILQTRILELFMRNPITSLYSETINSLVTIRAYNLENHFTYLVKNYLTHWTKANIAWWATSRYLSFFGELIAVAFSGISIIVLINDRSISIDTLGISIQYLVMITEYIQNICMGALEVNMQMSSPCRIQNYINFEQKENYVCDIDRVLKTQKWPRQGNITFQNVYMKYRENLKYQLKNINFRVNAGEKVAIIGRSGAGKSTIFSILFRIFEISKNQSECPNSTIFIDGVDISQVGVQLLRNAITIIPQFPQFFTGSLRENLDPFQRHTDYEIKGAIQLFELEKILAKLEDGLDTEAKNMIISIGARQLFFFVKAYLNKTKILLFDEATGMLDRQSSDVINKKVQTLFQNTTILTVAHRLQSVAFYDKIIMLEKGELIEQGHPYKLLVNDPKRDQTITNTSGYFSLMVQQEGKKTMQKFFKVCQQNYRQKVIYDQQQKLHNIQQSTLKNITSEIICNNRKKNATQYYNNKISNNNNDLEDNSNDLQLNKASSQPQQQFKQIQTLSNINKNFVNKEQIINDQLISMNGSQLI